MKNTPVPTQQKTVPYPLYIGLASITLMVFAAIIAAIIINPENLSTLILQITTLAGMFLAAFTGLYKSVEIVHGAVNSQQAEFQRTLQESARSATLLAATAGLTPEQTAAATRNVVALTASEEERALADKAELEAFRLAAQQNAAIVLAAQVPPAGVLPPIQPVPPTPVATPTAAPALAAPAAPTLVEVRQPTGEADAEARRVAAQRDAAGKDGGDG